jgi:hypothetical protein
MSEAFRQSFPLQHDLPTAMRALLSELAAHEAQSEIAALLPTQIPTAPKRPAHRARSPAVALADYDAVI